MKLMGSKLVLALILGMFAFAALARNQPPECIPYTIMANALVEYEEQLFEARVHQKNSRIEVWKSEDIGSWTVLAVDQYGMSCILGFGHLNTNLPKNILKFHEFFS